LRFLVGPDKQAAKHAIHELLCREDIDCKPNSNLR
jgi:hypothetical protein